MTEQTTPTTAEQMDGNDKSIALNRVCWLLAEAMGMTSGKTGINMKISDLVLSACDVIKRNQGVMHGQED